MDNDDATVGRILTRREALRVAARAGLGLAAIGGAYKAAPPPLLERDRRRSIWSPARS